jgi:tetratricopeptide (TPR) repeat protein
MLGIRGNAYRAKGQYDSAIEDYNEAIRLKHLPFWNLALRCQSKLTYHRETEGCCSVNRLERRDGASLFLSRSSAYIFALYCLCWGPIPFELPYYAPSSTSH